MWAMSEGYRRGEDRSREIKMGSYGIRACRPPALFIRKNRAGHVVRAARRGGSVATGFITAGQAGRATPAGVC